MKTKISNARLKKMEDDGAKKVLTKPSPKAKAASKAAAAEKQRKSFEQQQIDILKSSLDEALGKIDKLAGSMADIKLDVPPSPEITVMPDPRPIAKTIHVRGVERDGNNRLISADFDIEYSELH